MIGAVALAGPGAHPASASLDAQKQSLLAEEAAARAAGPIGTKPPLSEALPHGTPYPIPPRQGGLTVEAQGPFLATEFFGTSLWQGNVMGTWIQAYAGTERTAAMPFGALRLYTMPVDPNAPGGSEPVFVGTYRTPESELRLTIESVRDDVLAITGDSGRRYTFDIRTRSWASG